MSEATRSGTDAGSSAAASKPRGTFRIVVGVIFIVWGALVALSGLLQGNPYALAGLVLVAGGIFWFITGRRARAGLEA